MTSLYLTGEHAPLHDERHDTRLPVVGELPKELRGLFARNTPNPRFTPPGRYHWFDGDGMVHAIRFQDGQADYRNRWVRTPGFVAEQDEGGPIWSGILEKVDRTNPRGPIKDTANTHLIHHGGALLATWWLSGTPQALSLADLSTLGPPGWTRDLGRRTVTAHPKVDPLTGDLFFFGYSMFKAPFYWVGVVGADGALRRCEDVDAHAARIPHDIGFTERFVVLLDLPLGWDADALAAGRRRIGFDRGGAARIGLWPRAGGAVRWFEVPSCYVYHLTSSFERGDEVVITGGRIDDPIPDRPDETGTVPRIDLIHLTPVASRWTLNLKTGAVRLETLDDTPTEFPTVNDGYWGRPTRFAYHPRLAPRATVSFDGVIKLDHDSGATTKCLYPPGWFGGEVVFAPRPGSTTEDDGWVVTVLSHPDEARSEAWVIPAQDLASGPIARVRLPWRVPLGFHATWVPEASGPSA